VTTLPMFPLGSVLVPHQPLPLHVFEDRYRALVRDCLAGDRTFGVVLIERGHEVGGGDVRFDVGCTAVITEAEESDDGRWGVLATGGGRIDVRRWLPDDPYPVAEVEHVADGPWTTDARIALDGAVAAFGQVVDLAAELGAPVDRRVLELPDDPVVGHWTLVGRAPGGPLVKLGLLGAATPERRLGLLAEQLGDLAAVLASRLGGG
jgi:Lon protease-like protein